MRTRWSTWETESGTRMRIKDMADSHLLNAHRFMQRQLAELNKAHSRLDTLFGPERMIWANEGEDTTLAAVAWIAAFAGEIRRRHLSAAPRATGGTDGLAN